MTEGAHIEATQVFNRLSTAKDLDSSILWFSAGIMIHEEAISINALHYSDPNIWLTWNLQTHNQKQILGNWKELVTQRWESVGNKTSEERIKELVLCFFKGLEEKTI